MKVSDWLDKKEAEGVDVSHITLPANMVLALKNDEQKKEVFLRIC